MSVVVLAYHEMGCEGLRTLLRQGVDVSAVFTYDDDPDENIWFGSVKQIALDAGLTVHVTEEINAPRWVDEIARLAPDVVFSFYYRDMVGRAIRSIPRFGAVNMHGSLLPRYRGRSPINWQLVHGERESGVTLHDMVARADAGGIIGQERVAVGPDDTAIELYHKLLPAARTLLERCLPGVLDGTAPRTVQDESLATVFGGRRPADGLIDWTWPSLRVHDLVRAVAPPWPGAFSEGPDGRWMILRTGRATDASPPALDPGRVALRDGRAFVGTGDRPLELLQWQAPLGATLVEGSLLHTLTRQDVP
ncbi:MAG: formyltransferase [Planctomycetes bacterium]|nr:formyltransferase [Planctomycetota bacterium]